MPCTLVATTPGRGGGYNLTRRPADIRVGEIIAASIVISGRAAYLTAAVSGIFFGILVDGMYLGIIPYFDSNQKAEFSFPFVMNHMLIAWGVFFLVAYLINYLTGNLKKAREQLQLANKELELKQRFSASRRWERLI